MHHNQLHRSPLKNITTIASSKPTPSSPPLKPTPQSPRRIYSPESPHLFRNPHQRTIVSHRCHLRRLQRPSLSPRQLLFLTLRYIYGTKTKKLGQAKRKMKKVGAEKKRI
ncbi:unnamed protein product [Lactuca virosa]|uniref:Uncharacterized protein n=1 Tax=Lactuca virosa TaxID=75947 RepID=A0AAU9PRP3_9ASTR|nr:unnamed protein product [Lactuca virosa]